MIIFKKGWPKTNDIRFQAIDGKLFKTRVWCEAYDKMLMRKMANAKK